VKVNNVIAEIIDDESNKNILVYESSDYFSNTFSERGLNVYRPELLNLLSNENKKIDSAFISLNMNLFLYEKSDPILKISEALAQIADLNKVYILISSNSESKKIILNLWPAFKIKLLKNKIKFFFSSKPFFKNYEVQYTLRNNNKVQQILPKYLIKTFYKRSWKISSSSIITSLINLIRFFIIKYLHIFFSNDVLMVFEYEK